MDPNNDSVEIGCHVPLLASVLPCEMCDCCVLACCPLGWDFSCLCCALFRSCFGSDCCYVYIQFTFVSCWIPVQLLFIGYLLCIVLFCRCRYVLFRIQLHHWHSSIIVRCRSNKILIVVDLFSFITFRPDTHSSLYLYRSKEHLDDADIKDNLCDNANK